MSELAPLTPDDHQRLLWVAARVIAAGCNSAQWPAWTPDPAQHPAPLQQPGATFVTIRRHGTLRGCRGSVTATEPLVVNAARSARSAAFADERFPPVSVDELLQLELHLSILNTPESLSFTSESDLLAKLRPDRDGVILNAGNRQGLFLPAVWRHLQEPREFLEHLKQKAGLESDFWSDEIRVQRFTVDECHSDLATLLSAENAGDPRSHNA